MLEENNIEKKSIKEGLLWKLLERFGYLGLQFILQLILARILDPEHYGMLALMVIFTNLSQIFIQSGFNTSLIQNKDVTEEDYSSVFWVSLCISILIYLLLFIGAPAIADFYKIPEISAPFRVLALILIPGAFNSVQTAIISRKLDFKKVCLSNIGAITISGVIGIVLAYTGFGVWALVIQNLVNSIVICIIMWFTVKWRPTAVCNFHRIKVLFGFGWKILVSTLLDTGYQELRSLVIGKKFDAGTLGFYNRGKQFPQFVIVAINGAIQSVMLPVMSSEQDDKANVNILMRKAISLTSYVVCPMMAGLAAIAYPLVGFLITDKWIECVPFLQIYCWTYAFWPVHTCNLQAINAMGRSDIYLKLEILKQVLGIIALIIAITCFNTPIAIACTGVVTTVISLFINAGPNRKLIGYKYSELFRDIAPSFLASGLMFLLVAQVPYLLSNLSDLVMIMIQIPLGVLIYVFMSVIFKFNAYYTLKAMLKNMLCR